MRLCTTYMYMLLYISDADEELFEDNPEEYIRRDIEGSGNCDYLLSIRYV